MQNILHRKDFNADYSFNINNYFKNISYNFSETLHFKKKQFKFSLLKSNIFSTTHLKFKCFNGDGRRLTKVGRRSHQTFLFYRFSIYEHSLLQSSACVLAFDIIQKVNLTSISKYLFIQFIVNLLSVLPHVNTVTTFIFFFKLLFIIKLKCNLRNRISRKFNQ